MIGDYFKLALINLTHRRLRSWLTLIGIFIGITAVVALTSLGQGLQDTINREFETLGANRVMILPGGGSASAAFASIGGFAAVKLTDKDIKVVRDVRGVDLAGGMLQLTERVTFAGEDKYENLICISTDPDTLEYLESLDFFLIEQGRMLEKGDTRKVVAGYSLWNGDSFEKPVKRGDCVYIKGECFEVVGLHKRAGNPAHDQRFTVPREECSHLLNKSVDEVTAIAALVEDGFEPSDVAESIKVKLRKSRGVKEGEEDFNVQSAEQLMKTFTQIIDVVQTVITGIAAISLIVGAIGIMNTMYTSVIERTKQIGVMKAVGATRTDISVLFMIEAGLLGATGGIIGTILGLGIAKAVEFYAVNNGIPQLQVHMGMELICGVILFSFIIGSLSGLLPARQAANLQPVEALRK
ncbi:MAG: ABC transporter permease [Methanobacteriota archaeon]